ncbi:Thyrotropin receptor [Frankliniella fusca]|uniref:Thyrotropin receptor n=1 Tax=Frankliniella fusca TaxID=407009 RepID=A0AAE1I030_9NEOP|nr:Thyrotropin receptor [Frankliniella fusca]
MASVRRAVGYCWLGPSNRGLQLAEAWHWQWWTSMELLRSNKGTNLLVLNGFTSSEHSRRKNGRKIYWRCSECGSCNARVHTNIDFGDLQLLQDGTDKHLGHIEDHKGVETRRVMQGVKRKAEEHPNEAPTRLIRQAVAAINDPEVLARLPARNSVRRVVNQHQNLGRPRNPQELQDIILDSPYTTTKRGTVNNPDSGPGDPDRVIVFAAEASLRVLFASEIVFFDGTFKTVPNQFSQLYTVHGLVTDVASRRYVFPLVFCLCVRKNEATYRRIWEASTEEAARLGKRFRIRIMMTDFERAMFPDVQHKGCLFHFNQSLWRQVVNDGLRVFYVNAEHEPQTVRRDVQRLMALPFVPLADLEDTFDTIVEQCDDRVLSVTNSLEATYICATVTCDVDFPPELWNVYEQATENVARTTNVVEWWHSKFQKMLVVHHANIWKFLEEVRDEEHDFHQVLTQIRAGHIDIKQPNLAYSYEDYKERGEVMRYLEAISYNLKIQPDLTRQTNLFQLLPLRDNDAMLTDISVCNRREAPLCGTGTARCTCSGSRRTPAPADGLSEYPSKWKRWLAEETVLCEQENLHQRHVDFADQGLE